MNKKKIELLLVLTVFITTLSIVAVFGSFTYTSLKNQIVLQILEDNRSLGEHLFQLFSEEFAMEKSPEEQIRFLQKFSDEIMLPNGGFVCALAPDGEVIAFPGLKPGDKMNIGSFTIHDQDKEYTGTFGELEKGKPFAGILQEPDRKEQIIYSQPLGNTPLRLNIHQKMDYIDARIRTLLNPSLLIGLVLSISGSIAVLFMSNSIVRRYESRLEKLNVELAEVGHDRKQLLRVITHDLSNPLTIIDAGIEFIREDADSSDADMMENIDMVEMGVGKAKEIIDLNRELLALEDKQGSLPLKLVTVEESVREMGLVLKNRLEEKEIKLDIDLQKSLTVKVEPVSFLNSVLNNIMTNAVKFSFPRSTIEIKGKAEGAMTHISIKDTGIGMPQELVDKLFHAHEDTHRTGTGNETGTGFGMPIMKRFVEHYGGTVEVESVEGIEDSRIHGTTFHLYIPSN